MRNQKEVTARFTVNCLEPVETTCMIDRNVNRDLWSYFNYWTVTNLSSISSDWLVYMTPCKQRVTQGCVQPDWGYFEWTEQIISINSYK